MSYAKQLNTFNVTLILISFSLLINVGSYGVIETSDARYCEISREMNDSGDYLHPMLLGIGHFHKPPLTYYITTLGYKLWGTNPFGARFFIQIAILIQIILIYKIALTLWEDKKAALWSAMIYFSLPIVLISSRNLTTDAFLSTFIILSLYAWIKYRKLGYSLYLYLFALYIALGFLTKGPVVFIVPVLFIFAFNRTEPAKKSININHLLALLLFLAVSGLWFLFLIRENPEYFKYFIGHHTIDRFTKNAFGRTKPFWYYFAYAPLVGMPWLIIWPHMIWKNRTIIFKNSIDKVLVITFVLSFVFFSISSSKLILYILPLFSLVAISMAYQFKHYIIPRFYGYVILSFSGLIMASALIMPFVQTSIVVSKSIAIIGVIIGAFQVLIYYLLKDDKKTKLVFIASLTAALVVITSGVVMSDNQLKVNSTEPLAEFIQENNLNNRDIVVYNRRVPSLSFHLEKPIISLFDDDEGLNRETQFETDSTWMQNLINLNYKDKVDSLKHRLNKEQTVLVVYKNRIPENRKWLIKNYEYKVKMEQWVVYY